MIGQGIVPQGYHPVADLLPDDETLRRLASIRRVVAQTAPQMPTQDEFLEIAQWRLARQPDARVLTDLPPPQPIAECRRGRPRGSTRRSGRRASRWCCAGWRPTGRRSWPAGARRRRSPNICSAGAAEAAGGDGRAARDQGAVLLPRRPAGPQLQPGDDAGSTPSSATAARRDEPRPHSVAVQSEPLPELLPGFRRAERDRWSRDVVPRIWIGNAIRVAPHYDLMENIGCVVAGRRRFTVFPPEQLPNLYTGPFELTPAGTPVSLVDLAAPDLDRYPRFAEAWRRRRATARAGRRALPAVPLVARGRRARAGLDLRQLLVERGAQARPRQPTTRCCTASRLPPPAAGAARVWRMMFEHYVFGERRPGGASARGRARHPGPADAATVRADAGDAEADLLATVGRGIK